MSAPTIDRAAQERIDLEAYIMFFLDGCSYATIAAMQKCSERTARRRVHRGEEFWKSTDPDKVATLIDGCAPSS